MTDEKDKKTSQKTREKQGSGWIDNLLMPVLSVCFLGVYEQVGRMV